MHRRPSRVSGYDKAVEIRAAGRIGGAIFPHNCLILGAFVFLVEPSPRFIFVFSLKTFFRRVEDKLRRATTPAGRTRLMSLSIKTNVGALSAQQNISANDREKQRLFARLSSGSRINSAQDDAAGLAIADDLAAQLVSVRQAVRNGNDALNVTDTADAALRQAGDIICQLREL